MEKIYQISSWSPKNFAMILYFWAFFRMFCKLPFLRRTNGLLLTPIFGSSWSLTGLPHVLRNPIFVFVKFWWNDCSSGLLLPQRSCLHLRLPQTAAVVKSFILIIFSLIVIKFKFSSSSSWSCFFDYRSTAWSFNVKELVREDSCTVFGNPAIFFWKQTLIHFFSDAFIKLPCGLFQN